MRGAKARVVSLIPERMEIKDNPINKYVVDPLLTKPWLGVNQQVNPAEVVLSRRNIPFMVITKPQPVLTKIQNENFQYTLSGGLAILPKHPGSVWS